MQPYTIVSANGDRNNCMLDAVLAAAADAGIDVGYRSSAELRSAIADRVADPYADVRADLEPWLAEIADRAVAARNADLTGPHRAVADRVRDHEESPAMQECSDCLPDQDRFFACYAAAIRKNAMLAGHELLVLSGLLAPVRIEAFPFEVLRHQSDTQALALAPVDAWLHATGFGTRTDTLYLLTSGDHYYWVKRRRSPVPAPPVGPEVAGRRDRRRPTTAAPAAPYHARPVRQRAGSERHLVGPTLLLGVFIVMVFAGAFRYSARAPA